jgi:hypothetical protein
MAYLWLTSGLFGRKPSFFSLFVKSFVVSKRVLEWLLYLSVETFLLKMHISRLARMYKFFFGPKWINIKPPRWFVPENGKYS